MDMSFSGLLSYFEDIVSANPSIKLAEEEGTEEIERRKRKKIKKTTNK